MMKIFVGLLGGLLLANGPGNRGLSYWLKFSCFCPIKSGMVPYLHGSEGIGMMIGGNLLSAGFGQQRMGRQSFHVNSPPNFGVGGMPTKSAPRMSDEEFKTAIVEMARRHVAEGKDLSQAHHSSELQNMSVSYMSAASPDRKGYIDNTLSGFAGKLQRMAPTLNMKRFCLLDALMQNSNLFPNNRKVGNNFVHVTDSSGSIIAMFSELPPFRGGGMGWTFVPTEAEQARSREFITMYNDAWMAARELPGTTEYNTNTIIDLKVAGISVDIAALKAGGTAINMDKLAAHGITYDSETGQTAVNLDVHA